MIVYLFQLVHIERHNSPPNAIIEKKYLPSSTCIIQKARATTGTKLLLCFIYIRACSINAMGVLRKANPLYKTNRARCLNILAVNFREWVSYIYAHQNSSSLRLQRLCAYLSALDHLHWAHWPLQFKAWFSLSFFSYFLHRMPFLRPEVI